MDASDFMEPYPAAAATDDACIPQFIEIVPLTRDVDECDNGDCCVEVKLDILQQIKEKADEKPVCLCHIFTVMNYDNCHKLP